MDSSLTVMSGGKTVLNLNDCEINNKDARRFVKDLGKIDVVLNQFSMAGYNGHVNYNEHLPILSAQILQTMIDNHRDLKASITIPIASYIYFCKEDNKFMNEFSNSPKSIHDIFIRNKLECRFLSTNQTLDLYNMESHNKRESFERIKNLFKGQNKIKYDSTVIIELADIKNAFIERHKQLSKYYPARVLKKLETINIYIPDLELGLSISLFNGIFRKYEMKTGLDFDIQINSQPLYFAFKFTWGIQTLGVSARYLINKKHNVWKWYRIISSLNNAEIYLKFKYIFKKKNLMYFFSRFDGLFNQLTYQLKRMK